MMEPGTISKQKLDTVDLRLLNSEESQKHSEHQLTTGLLPTATTGQAETYRESDGKETEMGHMTNIESAESRINQLREQFKSFKQTSLERRDPADPTSKHLLNN